MSDLEFGIAAAAATAIGWFCGFYSRREKPAAAEYRSESSPTWKVTSATESPYQPADQAVIDEYRRCIADETVVTEATRLRRELLEFTKELAEQYAICDSEDEGDDDQPEDDGANASDIELERR